MTFDFSTLQEQFYKLPEEVQFALTSPHITEQIRAIAEKNGLLLDQMETLYDITSYVMLGLLPGDRYTSTLAKEINVSEKQARTITDEINNEVFRDIRDSMREFEENTKRANSAQRQQLQNQYQPPVETHESPSADTSIHADLEQAGNFKIETEASLQNNYYPKAPSAKPSYTTEQRSEPVPPKLNDLSVLTPPKEPEPTKEQLAPLQDKEVPPPDNTPVFDPKNFYNFINTDEQIKEEVVSANKNTNEDEISKTEKTESVSTNQPFQKSASTIHFEKEAKNKHTKISASQAYQPKIKEVATVTIEEGTKVNEEINRMEKENNAIIDEMIAHPKPIIEEVKINTTPTIQVETKPTPIPLITKDEVKNETITEQKVAEPPINLPVEEIPAIAVQKEQNKFVSAFDNKKEEVLVKKQDEPTTVVVPTTKVDQESVNLIKTEYPENTIEIPKTIEQTKTPSNEEIRNDIRSKVSEYNPSTKWETPITSSEEPKMPEKTEDVIPKNIAPAISPKVTPIQPPINRPSGFDPYREPVQ